ncbi:MAG: GTP cyclohydrolase II [Polyangiales bacterium]
MHVLKRIRPQHAPASQSATSSDRTDRIERPLEVIAPSGHVTIEANAPVPTAHGTFQMYVFRWSEDGEEHVAMVKGDLSGREAVAVRVHSECLTSEVFHSLKCDCREQLHVALDEISRRNEGAVLYLRQEGRGIGLANKVRAYALQARGADTVDANRMLGLPDDSRRYDMCALMLRELGVKSVRLMTNNPQKVESLRALGVDVVDRIPVLVSPNHHSAGYLETKRARMRHQLPHLVAAAGDGISRDAE